MARSRALRALLAWRAYVLGVLHKIACLACLKLMKCILDVFDHGALVNCGLYAVQQIILNEKQYELIYLMEGRKLLDAHVFNGWHENTKPIVTNIIVPWIFEIFVSFHYFIHTYMELKSIHYLVSLSQKRQPI